MSSINKIFDLFSQESEGDSEEEKKQEQIFHLILQTLLNLPFKPLIQN
jgi:hypothetical protein